MKISEAERVQKGIEEVVVNGMIMYKRKDRLFLTVEEAFFALAEHCRYCGAKKYEMDERCKSVPYKQNDDIFKKLSRGEVLVALVKF